MNLWDTFINLYPSEVRMETQVSNVLDKLRNSLQNPIPLVAVTIYEG